MQGLLRGGRDKQVPPRGGSRERQKPIRKQDAKTQICAIMKGLSQAGWANIHL